MKVYLIIFIALVVGGCAANVGRLVHGNFISEISFSTHARWGCNNYVYVPSADGNWLLEIGVRNKSGESNLIDVRHLINKDNAMSLFQGNDLLIGDGDKFHVYKATDKEIITRGSGIQITTSIDLAKFVIPENEEFYIREYRIPATKVFAYCGP